MKLIKSLLGRRQFLVTAAVTSALGLGYKRLAGIFDPGFQANGATVSDSFTSIAWAGEKAETGSIKATTNKYPHLLSPLRVRNRVLKNRIMHTPGTPGQVWGPERYPNDHTRLVYTELAKNAAIVTVR